MATRIAQKFSNQLPLIREAINGQTDLRSNQKLYKKIYRYYKDLGLTMSGDSNIDYQVILDCLYEDIL